MVKQDYILPTFKYFVKIGEVGHLHQSFVTQALLGGKQSPLDGGEHDMLHNVPPVPRDPSVLAHVEPGLPPLDLLDTVK